MSKTTELVNYLSKLNISGMYHNDFYWTWDKTDDELNAVFAVADALRDLRERGISRTELSRGSGIPYTTIDGWFKKGGDSVRLATLKRLAEYLGVSLDTLADMPGDAPSPSAQRDKSSYVKLTLSGTTGKPSGITSREPMRSASGSCAGFAAAIAPTLLP